MARDEALALKGGADYRGIKMLAVARDVYMFARQALGDSVLYGFGGGIHGFGLRAFCKAGLQRV